MSKTTSHNIEFSGTWRGKRYPEKEQRKAVKLMVKVGVVETKRRLNVSITSLYNWKKKFEAELADEQAGR